MRDAIKTDFFFKSIPSLQENDSTATKGDSPKGATENEKQLFALSQTKGWAILKEHVETLYRELNDVNKGAIASGASLEEIGRNAIVVNITQEIIEKILNKVSDSAEACNTNEQ